MEQEVISKKELLDATGISYGQLYRWKRKNIIPEEWFIKKSSFTGQETFFPKEKILERIEAIKGMKDAYSLDNLSAFFSPRPADVALSGEVLAARSILTPETLKAFGNSSSDEHYDFHSILFLSLAEELKGKIDDESCREMIDFMKKSYKAAEHQISELLAFQKQNVVIWAILSPPAHVYSSSEILVRVNLEDKVNQLKHRLSAVH